MKKSDFEFQNLELITDRVYVLGRENQNEGIK